MVGREGSIPVGRVRTFLGEVSTVGVDAAVQYSQRNKKLQAMGYANYREYLASDLWRSIRSRIMTQFHYTPADFGRDLSAHLGSAFSLEPVLWQSAYMRAHNRDDAISNLYFVGAGTHPGAGIPGVVGSAKATAALMMEVANA